MLFDKIKDTRLLIANRGEIAIRIARTAFALGIKTWSIYAEDDANSLHIKKTDHAIPLQGRGAAAYLDMEQIIAIAKKEKIQMIHPGYGFLSENPLFVRLCVQEGILFVGPSAEILELFGNKISARKLGQAYEVPVIPGTNKETTLEEAFEFWENLTEGDAMMIKALAGGGGRGMRPVHQREELESAYFRCQSEAKKAFGEDGLYVEKIIPQVRHVEVQVFGDRFGGILTLGERECTIQRKHQKMVEIAPCPDMPPELRSRLFAAATKMAKAVGYHNAGTFEFLVHGTELEPDSPFYFMETNPRLQVEHTVTEAVMGIDLVKWQLLETIGYKIEEIEEKRNQPLQARGFAIQCRINAEHMDAQGQVHPATGILDHFDIPTGFGVRMDSAAYLGFKPNPAFDSLLAKLICHSPSSSFIDALQWTYRMLCECHIEGIATNLSLLQNILKHPTIHAIQYDTNFIDIALEELIGNQHNHPNFYFPPVEEPVKKPIRKLPALRIPKGLKAIYAPITATVVEIKVTKGKVVHKGEELLVLEAMKMESLVSATFQGVVKQILVEKNMVVTEGQALFFLEPVQLQHQPIQEEEMVDLRAIRQDLSELQARKAFLWDENRPEAIAQRRKHNQRTARENIAALCDEDSFTEYGGLAIAAQRKRRPVDELVKKTPADGLITGFGSINGALFPEAKTKALVMGYDYTVLAGTQGTFNHWKMDRMLHLAEQWQTPIVIFAEGGGGRPGDVDFPFVAGLNLLTWNSFSKLKGIVPRLAIVSRYCFAGNAALAGCADVIIATEDVSIGMGGPAMIEGGGLGKYHPRDIGPAEVQTQNGVIDVLVKDEREAVIVAQKYLSYFQGITTEWSCADQRLLRHLVPENRRRGYDIRTVIQTFSDSDSVLELRPEFGQGMITALIRVAGRPLGLLANNAMHLGGAIDSEGAIKAGQFMELCNDFGLPIVTLCDTPGIMVGPKAEKSGTVRHASRLFVIGAQLKVPVFTFVLRKGYGLGAMAMAGGSFHVPAFCVAWPTAEFGAMGLEGAVKLGFRKELEQAESPEAREALYEKLVSKMYERGKGINLASYLEIDDVIDPKDTRKWILSGLSTTMKY